MTQGIFVGHHDRTGAVFVHYQERRCARQQLDETVTELCMGRDELGRLVQMVALELKLTKKDTADRDGAGPSLPRIVVERIPEVGPRRFYVLSADIEAHGRTGGSPGCAPLASHGRAIEPHHNECRERIRTRIERTLTGKARTSAYKDRIAETERVKERKRARVERGAGDASSTHVSLEYLASGETRSAGARFLCRIQVMMTMTCAFLRWMYSTRWMDARVVKGVGLVSR